MISEETKRQLIELCPWINRDKIVCIPVSVSDAFAPRTRDNHEHPFQILQIGTKPNKNVPRLISALDGLDCELTIVGERTDEIYDAMGQSSVEVTFLRNLTEAEIIAAYDSCDIVAFVSLEEGFGMPIVEAQRSGRPVVTSNCSVMPETAGSAAVLVDPMDIAEIRSGIVKLMRDERYRDELIRRGFENAQRFGRREIAKSHLAMYKALEKGDHP